MKVVLISKSDRTGGAAVVTFRLMEALRSRGVDARMLVVEKLTDSPYVESVGEGFASRLPFLEERLQIFLQNGFSRQNLFKADTASFGLPLSKHPLVKAADVVCLGWVNQGMLSLREIRKIAREKPVVWTMHDMWNLTGICHHAGSCKHFRVDCGCCPLLGFSSGPKDLSNRIHRRKAKLYAKAGISFVAVSSWLAGKAAESSLLGKQDVHVIPNPFPNDGQRGIGGRSDLNQAAGEIRIIIGAARLDDPIKGLPILRKALEKIRSIMRENADRIRLLTFGGLKDPRALDNLPVHHTHLGILKTKNEIAGAYQNADIVVSSSLFETLPGTLVEGMNYGCIPVAFDRGGQRDIIDSERSGVLVRFGDSEEEAASNLALGLILAARICMDSDMRANMQKMALATVMSKFSESAVADRFIYLFNQKLDERKNKG